MIKIQLYLIEALCGAFLVLFFDWNAGYWWNAIHTGAFELKSCWDGIAALAGGGVLAAIKYAADTWGNSPKGEMPYEKLNLIQKPEVKEDK